MRFSHLALAAVVALGVTSVHAASVHAEEAAAAADTAPAGTAVPEPAPSTAIPTEMELGPVGVDEHGHTGRIHVVQNGDTLWDISDAYLGTPWVWPSVWEDNDAIANPHLIYPGDRVWISPFEMRKVTDAEADALLAGAYDMPAAMEDPDRVPRFASRKVFRFSEIESAGFVSLDEITGAAAIVDSTEHERVWLSDNTPVIIGLGAGEAAVGDQFDIFRTGERVSDPETGEVVGYLTEELGWLEVTEVHDETATAWIRLSRSEMKRGDHLLPRRIRRADIEVMDTPDVSGQVMYAPDSRMELAQRDVLYLNRGTSHGIEVGSPLEIYRPMELGYDDAQEAEKVLPDEVVAKMIVVDVHDQTSVAVLTHTTRELTMGDHFRGAESVSP